MDVHEPKENIDDLLDNALLDFETTSKKKTKQKCSSKRVQFNNPNKNFPTEEELLSMFLSSGFSDNNAGVSDELDKLRNMDATECDKLVKEKLDETLGKLNLGADQSNIQMDDILKNLSTGAPEPGRLENLLPMMEGMMQSLMSKDLLYPPMKELLEKFPDWLADNRTKLSDEDFEKYNKQYDITKAICELFEQEHSDMDRATKTKNFEKIMELMQEMQNLGHPPKDLVGDNVPGFPVDSDDNPIITDSKECAIM